MKLKEIKKILEEKYSYYEGINDLEPDEVPWQVVDTIEEIYTEIFSYEEFNEFIKRKEELQKSFDPFKSYGNNEYPKWSIEESLLKNGELKMDEQEFLERFYNGKTFSEEELRDIVKEEIFDIVDTQLDNELHRWTRTVTTIFEVKGGLFALEWQQGLTEDCDDEFYNQPYEVEKKEKTMTVKVVEYVKKN